MAVRVLLIVIWVFCGVDRLSAQPDTIKVSEDIYLLKLTDDVFVHVTDHVFESFGKVSSNGLIILSGGEAVMVDTPVTPEQTAVLTRFVEDSFGSRITLLIASHWHDDCMGGIDWLHDHGASSLANEMTLERARDNGLTPPRQGFTHIHEFEKGGKKIVCHWAGGGHTHDNIVVWLPDDRILFGGCLIKDIHANNLGNLSDADKGSWPSSLGKLLEVYPDAEIVIPGHGPAGGVELIRHTLTLLQ